MRDRTGDIMGHRARRAARKLGWIARKSRTGFAIIDASDANAILYGVAHDLTASDVLGICTQETQRREQLAQQPKTYSLRA